MGNQKQPTNQPNHQPTDVSPTSDQPNQPTWAISYTNGIEKLDVSFQGEAGQVWNAGTQSTMRALIEKMSTPTQSSRAWIDSSYHQPTYHQLPTEQPALLPSPSPAPLMLAPAKQEFAPHTQSPNESPNQTICQPAPTPTGVLPASVPTTVSPSASPESTTIVRPRISKQILEVWGGRIALVANVGGCVLVFYLLFFYAPTRERIWSPLWNFFFPSAVEQTKPVKPNVQPKN